LVLVAVLQATLVSHLALWGVFVDLPVLVVVSWSLLRGPREGMLWGAIAGVVVDLLSGAPFGAATLSLIAVGFLLGLGKTSVFAAADSEVGIVFPVVMAFLATVLYDLFFLFIVWISGYTVVWLDSLLRIILPSAVLNAALMPVLFPAMRMLHARFGREEMEW
jgi:rod shape-determining protein MreD